MKVTRVEAHYYKADPTAFSPDNFPVLVSYGKDRLEFYMLPIEEYPGLIKVTFCQWLTVQLLSVTSTMYNYRYLLITALLLSADWCSLWEASGPRQQRCRRWTSRHPRLGRVHQSDLQRSSNPAKHHRVLHAGG